MVPWFAALAMAASPELHEHVHEDAHHAEHECVVTHMLAGDFGEATPPVLLTLAPAVPLAEFAMVDDRGEWVRPLFLANGVLEHAPPVPALV